MGIYAYTPSEEKKIIEMYRNGSKSKEINDVMKRTPNAIEKKISRLISEGRLEPKKIIPESPYPIMGEGDVLTSEGDALVISDLEVPFHHADFVNRTIELAQKWGIKTLHLDGDLLHYESLGRWGASWTSVQDADANKVNDFLLEIEDDELRAKGIALMDELNAFKEKQNGYQDEINEARRVFSSISGFDEVLVSLGNHDDRFFENTRQDVGLKRITAPDRQIQRREMENQ